MESQKSNQNKVGMTQQKFHGLPSLHLANHTHTPQSPPCMPHHVASRVYHKTGIALTQPRYLGEGRPGYEARATLLHVLEQAAGLFAVG